MGLSFLSPALLGGAAIVAVPIVLHLIMRRKPVPHEFPALRFLRERATATRRRLRLSHILLLLLRMAALLLLATALARPVLRGAGWLGDREGPVAAAFVFDTAPRMLLREANRSRLDQAKTMAQVLFGKLPAASKVAVIDTSGGAAAFAPTVAAAAVRIERLAAATPAASLSAAIADGLRLLEAADLSRRELYVFTDCSHGAWDGAEPLEIAKSHPGTAVLFVDVAASDPRNFAIEAIDLSTDQLPAGAPLAIAASTGRSGPEATRAVAVEVLAPDGHYARRAVKPVDWRAGGSGRVDFEIAGLEPGLRQGRVIIDGSDDLEADDVRSFTVEVGAPARVIVAAPAPAARTGLFMMQALAPLALRKAGKARFDAVLVDVATLDAASWDDARGMVLVDPPPLPPRTWEMLEQWVATGRGLAVWLGPRAGDAARFNSEASSRVLGGRIVRVWRSPDGGNFLVPAALDHPILAAFRRTGDEVPWQDFPVSRHWELTAPVAGVEPAAGAATVVAAYRNGLPAILEHRVGQGAVVVFTTPVSQTADDPDAWNSLATGFEPWPFVMLANEALLHVIDTADSRNVTTGAPAVLHLDRRDIAAAFVRTPAGDDFPAAIDPKRGTITVTATQLPGNYLVRAGGEDLGVNKGFSANLPAAATDYGRLAPDALAAVLGEGHRLARTESELVRDVNLERIGAELFGWLILLAAVVMAADWMVANRFYAPREGMADATRPAEAFMEAVADVPPPAGPPPVPPAPPPPGPPPFPPPPPVPVSGASA